MVEINSLWIGEPLSTLERLCIESHLQNGHEYHLWTYGPLDAPDGVIIEDGNDILPESSIFCYSGPESEGGGSVSAFSNLFRYRLLKERGGWWCDTDVVALKTFEFDEPYVFASENVKRGGGVVPTTCVIKVPPASLVMNLCYKEACSVNRETVEWGTIGPKLLGESIKICNLDDKVAPPESFCPIDWWDVKKLLGQAEIPEFYSVHLWHEMWRRGNYDKDGSYRSDCLYERLKEMYLYK